MEINIGICKEQLRTSIRAAAIDTHSQTWRLKIFADEAYFHLSNVDERSARRVIGSNEYGLHWRAARSDWSANLSNQVCRYGLEKE
ncbi:hypothetical protein [Rhizobium ruizarguesonis]|uniref:hypothetical protein n=1 Tax=Rhizobium ruizarguesonis TaxID=2081791 RepID=UPI00102F9F1E|nr:hypothetical protein [Rhizobium ruizarguesonis]TBE87712.1 hypothetical protein ELG99_13080 [Rhizobium ruizarguesonis]